MYLCRLKDHVQSWEEHIHNLQSWLTIGGNSYKATLLH